MKTLHKVIFILALLTTPPSGVCSENERFVKLVNNLKKGEAYLGGAEYRMLREWPRQLPYKRKKIAHKFYLSGVYKQAIDTLTKSLGKVEHRVLLPHYLKSEDWLKLLKKQLKDGDKSFVSSMTLWELQQTYSVALKYANLRLKDLEHYAPFNATPENIKMLGIIAQNELKIRSKIDMPTDACKKIAKFWLTNTKSLSFFDWICPFTKEHTAESSSKKLLYKAKGLTKKQLLDMIYTREHLKSNDKRPLALMFMPEADASGAFKYNVIEQLYDQNYSVIVYVTYSRYQVYQIVKTLAEKKLNITMLGLCGHGSDEELDFGKTATHDLTSLRLRDALLIYDMAPLLAEILLDNAVVFMDACDTYNITDSYHEIVLSELVIISLIKAGQLSGKTFDFYGSKESHLMIYYDGKKTKKIKMVEPGDLKETTQQFLATDKTNEATIKDYVTNTSDIDAAIEYFCEPSEALKPWTFSTPELYRQCLGNQLVELKYTTTQLTLHEAISLRHKLIKLKTKIKDCSKLYFPNYRDVLELCKALAKAQLKHQGVDVNKLSDKAINLMVKRYVLGKEKIQFFDRVLNLKPDVVTKLLNSQLSEAPGTKKNVLILHPTVSQIQFLGINSINYFFDLDYAIDYREISSLHDIVSIMRDYKDKKCKLDYLVIAGDGWSNGINLSNPYAKSEMYSMFIGGRLMFSLRQCAHIEQELAPLLGDVLNNNAHILLNAPSTMTSSKWRLHFGEYLHERILLPLAKKTGMSYVLQGFAIDTQFDASTQEDTLDSMFAIKQLYATK